MTRRDDAKAARAAAPADGATSPADGAACPADGAVDATVAAVAPAVQAAGAANDAISLANRADEKSVGNVCLVERQTGAEEPAAPMNVVAIAPCPSARRASPPADAPPPPADPPSAPAERPSPPADHVARVTSKAIQSLIALRLTRAGLNEADAEELKQEITVALVTMADPPTDDESCAKAAHDITSKQVAGFRRKGYRRGKYNVGPTDQADCHATDDAREQASGEHAQRLATVREAMADGTITDRDAKILALKHEGRTDAEVAEELGIAKQTVSNRVATVRKVMRDRWSKRVAAGALALFAALVIVFVLKRRDEEARNRLPPAPAPVPSAAPQIPVALQAAELRRGALEDCANARWARCSERLEAARKLDPAGEVQPMVRALRHVLEDNARGDRHSDAKVVPRP